MGTDNVCLVPNGTCVLALENIHLAIVLQKSCTWEGAWSSSVIMWSACH